MKNALFSGNKVADARFYLEDDSGKRLVALQETGSKGKVGFKYPDAGSYRLVVFFHQQEAKWLKEKSRHSTFTKASFNPKTKTYFYQGSEGFFSIKLFGLKKIENESVNPVFREIKNEEEPRTVILQFKATKREAQISATIKVLTAAQFKRATNKINHDISMISIRGIK